MPRVWNENHKYMQGGVTNFYSKKIWLEYNYLLPITSQKKFIVQKRHLIIFAH